MTKPLNLALLIATAMMATACATTPQTPLLTVPQGAQALTLKKGCGDQPCPSRVFIETQLVEARTGSLNAVPEAAHWTVDGTIVSQPKIMVLEGETANISLMSGSPEDAVSGIPKESTSIEVLARVVDGDIVLDTTATNTRLVPNGDEMATKTQSQQAQMRIADGHAGVFSLPLDDAQSLVVFIRAWHLEGSETATKAQ